VIGSCLVAGVNKVAGIASGLDLRSVAAGGPVIGSGETFRGAIFGETVF
jgi:hypothetical protein